MSKLIHIESVYCISLLGKFSEASLQILTSDCHSANQISAWFVFLAYSDKNLLYFVKLRNENLFHKICNKFAQFLFLHRETRLAEQIVLLKSGMFYIPISIHDCCENNMLDVVRIITSMSAFLTLIELFMQHEINLQSFPLDGFLSF